MSPARSLPAHLLLEHEPFLHGLARALLADEHAARDVVQDAWVAALERGPRNAGRSRAWLASVTANLARNARRGEARRAERERRAARAEATDSVAAAHERVLLQRDLVQAVVALPEPYKTVVVLRYYEGLAPAAIAQRLERPVGTVRSQLTRGLEQLRATLDGRYGGDRARWSLVLAPLLLRPVRATAAATASAAPVAAVVAAAVGLGAVVTLLVTRSVEVPRETLATLPMTPASAPAPAPTSAPQPAVAPQETEPQDEALPVDVDALGTTDLIDLAQSLRPVLDERLLAPDPRFAREHAAFLERPLTGLARLLPRGAYEQAVTPRGGGAYYSFATQSNSYDDEPDIQLQHGRFQSGFYGASEGFVLDLGEVDLAELPSDGATPASLEGSRAQAWRFFWDARPEGSELPAGLRRFNSVQTRRAGELGLDRVAAVVGRTYAVRSYLPLEHELIAAFTVLDEDAHGLTILWCILEERPMPREPESPTDTAEPAAPAPPEWSRYASTETLIALLGRVRERCEERLFAIPAELEERFSEYTRAPDRGVARLLHAWRFRKVVSLDGGGAYVSFTTRSNDYQESPDLQLAQGTFRSGFAGADFGFVLDLGERPLESLANATSDPPAGLSAEQAAAWRFLWSVQPEREDGDVRRLTDESRTEARELGVLFGAPAVVEHTYLVRSTHWDWDREARTQHQTDLLVAFTCVAEDEHGVFLVWRILAERGPSRGEGR